jgi:hypothetical protein
LVLLLRVVVCSLVALEVVVGVVVYAVVCLAVLLVY